MIRFSLASVLTLTSAILLAAGNAGAQTAEAQGQPPAEPQASSTPTPSPAPAATDPVVGGAPMSPTATIVENAAKSKDHTTLVSAIKAAGLDGALSGAGPFTVFAPVNDAFNRLAPGTLDTLMKPENKELLTKVLKYHVVPGKLTFADLEKLSTEQGGTAKLTTLEGGELQVKATKQMVELIDGNGNKAYVSQPDIMQSNGVIHVTNGVVLPKLAAAPAAPAAAAPGPKKKK